MECRTALERTVRERIARAYRPTPERGVRGDEGPGSCAALWVLPELVDLLIESHDRPAGHLAPRVRRLILEQHFVDESGDNVLDNGSQAEVERQVGLIVSVLEDVRHDYEVQGQWQHMPAAPMMFG